MSVIPRPRVGWLRWALVALTAWALPAGGLVGASASSAGAAATGVKVSLETSVGYGSVLVVGSSPHNVLNGFPLYIFSGDADGHLGCTTKRATGYDLGPSDHVSLTCTGPESDMVQAVQSDDWPALTTAGAPIAGKGVVQRLLGTIHRKGIGYQVTYAGYPLYLFDPWVAPFDPQGELYLETVHPLAPWHGLWTLIGVDGLPDPGVVTLKDETLTGGGHALSVAVDPNVKPVDTSVYSFSKDRAGVSSCYAACAVEWIPLLTSSKTRLGPGIVASAVGSISRRDGSHQVTYEGRPLYIYARERVTFNGVGLDAGGSAGNGNGVHGPHGGTFSLIRLP